MLVMLDKVVLYEIRMPFRHFFETSFGRTYDKEAVLVEVAANDLTGWGECVACEGPFYSYEDRNTAWYVLSEYLIPWALEHQTTGPEEFLEQAARIRGHNMAKAALEMALWDLNAKREGVPLWKKLGGCRKRIPCGVSIGIQDNPEQLIDKITRELEDGYRKIKVKIKPGWDLEILERIRSRFPEIPLMADANSAYTVRDIPRLRELDRFRLMMVEQPLYDDDIAEHARLQEVLETPVCLDESIRHVRDARLALDLGACRIINIKPGRVGGLIEARKIHDLCRERGVPVWCGGMLETGIGRAHNISLSTLENFTIPGDVSAGRRYFERDTVRSPVEVEADGTIKVRNAPGIGWEPERGRIDEITVRRKEFVRQ